MFLKSGKHFGTLFGTTTAGVSASAQLVSGTAVQIAGTGFNLTALPLSRNLTVRMRIPSAPREGEKAFVIRGRKSRKIARPVLEIAGFIQRRAIAQARAGEVQVAKILAVASSKAPPASLKIFGKAGTAALPTNKSYDIDLDDYQE
jgi:hypothetical protein